jgi:negative regulator of sigma E activity
MPCEPHKVALIEAVASGLEPQGELRAHLATCAACHATFTQEQSLYFSIDAGLRTAANAEVPASLLPRVRARLADEPAPRRMWTQPLIFAAASAALALAIFLVVRPHHTRPDNQSKQIPQLPLSETPAANARRQNSGPAPQIVSSNVNNSGSSVRPTLLRPVASSQPEVLVSPDEREAYANFVFTVQQRHDVAEALLAPSSKKQDALVTVEPLQIAHLELKPLEGRETEISGRVDELR